jgi:hypothetical protein
VGGGSARALNFAWVFSFHRYSPPPAAFSTRCALQLLGTFAAREEGRSARAAVGARAATDFSASFGGEGGTGCGGVGDAVAAAAAAAGGLSLIATNTYVMGLGGEVEGGGGGGGGGFQRSAGDLWPLLGGDAAAARCSATGLLFAQLEGAAAAPLLAAVCRALRASAGNAGGVATRTGIRRAVGRRCGPPMAP